MKKFILSTLFFLNISYFCFAQPEGRVNKIESIQVAYLTKELSLTPEEAQKFWPVYNEYKSELSKTRKESRQDEVAFEEKVLNIRKKYKVEFRKVLGTEQRANQVFVVEKGFREMLRKELMNRRKNQKADTPD